MERFYNSRNEKQSIYDIFRACRLCGAGGGYKMPIIHDINLSDIVDVEIELKRKIRECVSIEVHADDKMPPLICELCVDKVNDFYEFREMCRETNERTRARLGLPPQTLGPADSEDCILGFTSPVYPSPNQAPKESPAEEIPRVSQGRGRPRKKPRDAKSWIESPTTVPTIAGKTRRSVEKEKKVDTPPPTPPPTRSSRKETRQQQGILKNSKANKLSVSPQPLLKEKGRGKREAEREPIKTVKKVKLQVTRTETPPPVTRGEKRRAVRAVSPPTPKLRRAHAVSHAPPTESFKCELCGAGYVKKSSLSNHMVSMHSPSVTVDRLACTPCREWFASAEDAAAHHRWHKATATFYHCHACTADFKQLSGFNKHFTLKQCVPEHEVPDLQCGECWLTFPTSTWMEQHNCGGPDARPGGECYKCRKKFAKYKQLSKHEETCIGKGKKIAAKPDAAEVPASEETQPRIQPVQIRMQRCDKLLQRIKREPPEHDAYYDVSEVKPEFGLDKSCTYPYISSVGTVRIKTEPENHDSDFITSDNIKQEIKEEVSYDQDYLDTGFGDDYYSDGSENADEGNQPAPKMVINPFARKQVSSVEKLSTISLRTIFSGQFLGKVPLQKRKRKKKIKQQPLDDFSLEVKTEIMAEEEERTALEASNNSLFDSILDDRAENSRLSGESAARDYVEESRECSDENIEAKEQNLEKVTDSSDTESRLEVSECPTTEEVNTESSATEDRTEYLFVQEKEDSLEKEDHETDLNKEEENENGEITLERDSDNTDVGGEKSEIGLVENNLENKDLGEKVSDENDKVFGDEELITDKERTEGENTKSDETKEKEVDNGFSNNRQSVDFEELNENVDTENKEQSADLSSEKLEKEAETTMTLVVDNYNEEESVADIVRMEQDDVEALPEDEKENDDDIQGEDVVNASEVPNEGKMDVDAAMEELEAVLLMGNEDSKEGKVDELPQKSNSESDEGNELLADESLKDAEVPLVNQESKENEKVVNLDNSVSEVPEEEMDFDINSVFGGELGPVALKSTCKISTPKKFITPEENKISDPPLASKDDSKMLSANIDSEATPDSRKDKFEEDIVSDRTEDMLKVTNNLDVVKKQESDVEQESDEFQDEESKDDNLENLQNLNQSDSVDDDMISKAKEKVDEAEVPCENKEIGTSTLMEKAVESEEAENRTDIDEASDIEYDENELLKEPEENIKEQEDSEQNVLIATEKVDKNSEHDILDLVSDSGDDCNIIESPDKQTKNRGVSNDEKSEDCDGGKISLDELLLASKEVSRLPEDKAVPKSDKNSMDLDSISDDEFDFDQN